MKIFSASQIKACDAYTIRANNLTSIELVERAANACATFIQNNYSLDTPFVLLCGMGNNGADGLALARILKQSGYAIKVFLLQHSEEPSPENKANLNQLLRINASMVEYMPINSFLADLPAQAVIIDAILGTGLSRPLDTWLADFIQHLNHFPNRKIAIDIPSGMPSDTLPNEGAAMVSAQHTLSFQLYKRSFLHPETAVFCGEIHLLDIGLHPTFIEATHTHYQTIESEKLLSFLKTKKAFSYKNEYGHAFIIGGSQGKGGAALLATGAALRSGVGLVTSCIPDFSATAFQVFSPEAMSYISGKDFIEKIEHSEDATAIGVGIGMGTEAVTVDAFTSFVAACNTPCVFDADALNILAQHQELMNKIPPNSILTPHVGECDRLFGKSENSMQRVEHVRMQAMRYNVCIVLKGHHTVIVAPNGDCFYNTNGNAGMAKGGSGDVLTGLLAGILAQGYNALQTALLGVYLHSVSGDIAAEHLGQQAMNATDLIKHLNEAWQKLSKT